MFEKDDYQYGVDVHRSMEGRMEAENAIWALDPETATPADFARMQKIILELSKGNTHFLKEMSKATDLVLKVEAEKVSLLQYLVKLQEWVADGCRYDQRPRCPDWIGD